ncbi:MAG: hypothetical protein WB805_07530 [Candidatus Dormiibacterota bacterium]
MDDQGTIEIEEARIRRLLQHAAEEIGGSQPEPSRVKRPRGRRSAAVVAVTVFALAASAGTGFAVGRSAPTSPTSSVRLASLPTEPPVVEAALKALYQLGDPLIVQRVDSVEVKYVSDQEFWHAISNAWQSRNPADCGTFSGPSGAIGHWYVVDLHGKFVSAAAGGVATQYASVDVVMVPATDLQGYLRAMPPYVRQGEGSAPTPGDEVVIVPPAPSGPPTNVSAGEAGVPPLGTDGEPLCWSLLPSSN